MTPTPPSTAPSTNGHSPNDQGGQYRVVRKRNRIPLSCAPCRHRKLKCNRGHPCDNCTKRADSEACTYAAPGARKKVGTPNSSNGGSPDEMQNRIDRLESLVLSLMTNGSQSAGPAAANAALATTARTTGSSMSGSSAGYPLDVDSVKEEAEMPQDGEEHDPVEQVSQSMGVMKVDSNRNIFASEQHWYSILAEISEVKNYFAEHKKQFETGVRSVQENQKRNSTGFLFITEKPAPFVEILGAFPSKATTDVLISRFFNTYNYDPAFQIIHGPTYQKQYDRHWANPNQTEPIWLGMTYAMMLIAVQSYYRNGDEPQEYRGLVPQMLDEYRRGTAQCLILADITQPITHMLETLILYTVAEFGRSRDAETGILIGVSVIVRLAMKMGYHRDAKDFPNMPPFQGEMRRRIWAVVRQWDILFSTQAGMPPMIRPSDTNTDLPLNIYDDELMEDMKATPLPRPITETTPMTYIIYKAQLISVFSQIVEAVQTLTCSSYETVMTLDHRLREVQANIPPVYKMRSMEESLRDQSPVVMQRYILDLLFLKSQCVLHRKFVFPSRDTSRYAYSRRTCVDNAITMLQHQATLHQESRPGGRLNNVQWFISSLTSHDFILAAMIVALDLYHTAEAERTGRRSSADVFDYSQDRRTNMLVAVENSRNIWETYTNTSVEAMKAAGALTAMLEKLQTHETQLRQQYSQAAPFTATNFGQNEQNVAPEHSAAMTLGLLSQQGAISPNANMFAQYDPQQPQTSQAGTSGMGTQFLSTADQTNGPTSGPSPFSQMFGASSGLMGMDLPATNIDWDAWDSYIQGSSIDPNGNNLWPGMNIDVPTMAGAESQTNGLDQQTASNANSNNNYGNIFMGVSTPPGLR
ncbi:hypothetical protein EJ08DRAFT_578598 [Tothia fuscella]|uniref:Zn(2)-C6 fungal-type domain-containing protein n=1 Tax=Tothia fuscella TaxID=1048955 RepID=A0A9P4P4I4_9PEZI|nr:hypothetical protein EJ08DRAFT_578598 [Tothia fuscella]